MALVLNSGKRGRTVDPRVPVPSCQISHRSPTCIVLVVRQLPCTRSSQLTASIPMHVLAFPPMHKPLPFPEPSLPILLPEVIPIITLSYNMRTSRKTAKQPMRASSCWRNSQKLELTGEEQGRVHRALQPRTPSSWGSELFWPIPINAPIRRGGFNVISSLDDFSTELPRAACLSSMG